MSALPPEIVDTVIDYLHNDKASLESCALVCQSWSISSRYHLFDEHGVSVKPGNIHNFLSDISHSHSMLKNHLGCLTLRTEFNVIPSQARIFEWKDVTITLPHLPNLTSLRFHSRTQHIRFSYHILPQIFSPKTLQNITHLEVARTFVQAAEDIISIISLFPRLQEAQFFRIHWRHCSFSNSLLSLTFPLLKHLSLSYVRSPGEVLRCISRLDPVPLLPRIDVGHIDTLDIPSVNQYLHILGASLDMFCIGLNDRYSTTLDLSLNPSLRCLRLLECEASKPALYLARVMGNIKSTNLDILALDIQRWYLSNTPGDWEALDQYLLELWDVLRLKAVYIVSIPSAEFTRKLPRCQSQIILHIKTSSQIESCLG